ncbi:hypothetical protein ACROYT_G014985 [Oculina patagonica]
MFETRVISRAVWNLPRLAVSRTPPSHSFVVLFATYDVKSIADNVYGIKGATFAQTCRSLHTVMMQLLENVKLGKELKESEWKRLWTLAVMYKMKAKTDTVIVTDASVYSNQHVQYRTLLYDTVFDLLATKAIQFDQVLTQFQDLTCLYGIAKPTFTTDDLQFCFKVLKNSSDCLELYVMLFGCSMDTRGIFVYEHLNFTHDQMDHLMGLDRSMELKGIDMCVFKIKIIQLFDYTLSTSWKEDTMSVSQENISHDCFNHHPGLPTKHVKKNKSKKAKKRAPEETPATPLQLNQMVRVEEVLEEGEIAAIPEGEYDPDKALAELSQHLQDQKREQQEEPRTKYETPVDMFGFQSEDEYPVDDIHRLAKALPDELLEAPQFCCPVHQTTLKHFTSQQGDNYLRCNDLNCVVFCSEDDAETYLNALHDLHYSIRVLLSSTLLKRKSLSLRLSHSQDNPGRLYLTSRDPSVKFFQWGDELLSNNNRLWLYDEKLKANPPYRVKDIRQYCNPQMKFKAPIKFTPVKRRLEANRQAYYGKLNQPPQKRSKWGRGFIMTDTGNKIASPPEFRGFVYTPELDGLWEKMKVQGPPYDFKLLKKQYQGLMKDRDMYWQPMH